MVGWRAKPMAWWSFFSGIYEIVSRRDHPPRHFDEAFDAVALAIETVTGRFRAGSLKAGDPAGASEQESLFVAGVLEAFGLLRAGHPEAYAAIIFELFRRDPVMEEFRLVYWKTNIDEVSRVLGDRGCPGVRRGPTPRDAVV